MYHNVAEPPAGAGLPSLYVPPRRFEAQMGALARLGLRGVAMSEGMRWLAGEGSGRLAVVTLDDGYRDNVENALPILTRLGFRATCYVTSGALGAYNRWDAEKLGVRKPVMGEAELREWIRSGMEVGAHTRTHPHLTTLPPREIEAEVRGCKEDLEVLVDTPVVHFCYPYGDLDERVVDAVRRAGFESATTVRRARARPGEDPYRLPRVLVKGEDPLARFLLKLLTRYEDHRGRKDEARRARASG